MKIFPHWYLFSKKIPMKDVAYRRFFQKVPNDIGENSDVLAQGTKTKKVPYTICD
ncbi:hypothetical protein [Klebsiella pneumoniae]|uniref:hypothetical protein n=1 Tax=Klebsiella pneumoniae TaxID=573 RepID=UPI000A7E1082|nr:hypothetical protein [Klebsiella pneumoniae]EMF2455963.1 hypothetical protein [Klebsiella pneumoniae]HBS6116053.1 hypothetical protein [Klebsiella pneumoniae]HDZ2151207.1 hypothetical protein [Klebsiella pneumoniae]